MNVSKILVSSIAAVSVVGAISLAYAQTTTEVPANSTGPMTPPAAQNPSATPVEITPSAQLAAPVPAAPAAPTEAPTAPPTPTAAPAQPMPDSTINSTVATPPSDGAMATERAAQVDRN